MLTCTRTNGKSIRCVAWQAQPEGRLFDEGAHVWRFLNPVTAAHDMAQVKDDGCGACPQHEPFAAMRDALNRTGRPIFYAIHSSIIGTGNPNATVANMWRTGSLPTF